MRPLHASRSAVVDVCKYLWVLLIAVSLSVRVIIGRSTIAPLFAPRQTITAGYRGALKACANGGQWEEALSVLQRMLQDSDATVTTRDYNTAILACVRAQQSVAALTLLGDMSVESETCKADETSYILVMRAFGREGRSASPLLPCFFLVSWAGQPSSLAATHTSLIAPRIALITA